MLRYEPSLDGLRGLAVAGVLLFHGGFAWASGGFLGVSTFFTLSGFLITSLMLTEHAARGRITLRTFWARRARRLLPAALVTLAVIVVFGATVATPDQLRTLPGDVLAALGYASNWRFVATDQAYSSLFAAPSPVLHFWSLAIEEQLYLVLPLVVFASVVVGRGSRRTLGIVLLVATLASITAMTIGAAVGAGAARLYYGTDTRAAELLVGALLAVALRGRLAVGPRVARVVTVAAPVVLVALLWSWSAARTTSPELYRGGLVLHAVGTAIVLVGALVAGPVRALLAFRPLVGLGRISYGVYLLHWPIFLWLTPERLGLDRASRFAVAVAVTLVVAIASYVFIEQPIRTGRRLRRWKPLVIAPVTACLVGAGVFATSGLRHEDAARAISLERLSTPPEPTTAVAAGPEAPPPPVRVLLVGDSLGRTLGPGLARFGGGSLVIDDRTALGCGFAYGGRVRVYDGLEGDANAACDTQAGDWSARLASFAPDLTVALECAWDVADRQLPGDEEWRAAGDPVLDGWLAGELARAADVLTATGVPLVWLACPVIDRQPPPGAPPRDEPYPESDPARVARLNVLIGEVAATRPLVTVVDLAAFVDRLPGGPFDPALRPDRVHFNEAGASTVASWLGPQLEEVAR